MAMRWRLTGLGMVLSVSIALSQSSPLPRPAGTDFRFVSWNVSGPALFEKAADYRTVFKLIDADILVLDEAQGGKLAADVEAIFSGLRGAADTKFHVVVGEGGGYQRGVIVSRYPMTPVAALNGVVPFPPADIDRLKAVIPAADWERIKRNLDTGIAVAGGVVTMGTRRILAVSVDLQCCNGTPDWQELRRQIEIREIRTVLRAVLGKVKVDAALLAGDFNLVSTGTPLAIIGGPYPPPVFGLVPVDARHMNGLDAWTWDGRSTQFPSRALDFSLYSPGSLEPLSAIVFTSETLPQESLRAWRLTQQSSRELSAHLPIVVDYRWRR